MDHLLNKQQMAKSCGISTQAFDKWEVPIVKKEKRQCFFSVSDVLENRIANATKKLTARLERHEEDDQSHDKQKIRETKERADNLALKNDMLRRDTAPIEIISFVIAKIVNQIAPVLDSLPINIKRKLPGITSTELEVISREIIKAQNNAADSDKYVQEFLDEFNKTANL